MEQLKEPNVLDSIANLAANLSFAEKLLEEQNASLLRILLEFLNSESNFTYEELENYTKKTQEILEINKQSQLLRQILDETKDLSGVKPQQQFLEEMQVLKILEVKLEELHKTHERLLKSVANHLFKKFDKNIENSNMRDLDKSLDKDARLNKLTTLRKSNLFLLQLSKQLPFKEKIGSLETLIEIHSKHLQTQMDSLKSLSDQKVLSGVDKTSNSMLENFPPAPKVPVPPPNFSSNPTYFSSRSSSSSSRTSYGSSISSSSVSGVVTSYSPALFNSEEFKFRPVDSKKNDSDVGELKLLMPWQSTIADSETSFFSSDTQIFTDSAGDSKMEMVGAEFERQIQLAIQNSFNVTPTNDSKIFQHQGRDYDRKHSETTSQFPINSLKESLAAVGDYIYVLEAWINSQNKMRQALTNSENRNVIIPNFKNMHNLLIGFKAKISKIPLQDTSNKTLGEWLNSIPGFEQLRDNSERAMLQALQEKLAELKNLASALSLAGAEDEDWETVIAELKYLVNMWGRMSKLDASYEEAQSLLNKSILNSHGGSGVASDAMSADLEDAQKIEEIKSKTSSSEQSLSSNFNHFFSTSSHSSSSITSSVVKEEPDVNDRIEALLKKIPIQPDKIYTAAEAIVDLNLLIVGRQELTILRDSLGKQSSDQSAQLQMTEITRKMEAIDQQIKLLQAKFPEVLEFSSQLFDGDSQTPSNNNK